MKFFYYLNAFALALLTLLVVELASSFYAFNFEPILVSVNRVKWVSIKSDNGVIYLEFIETALVVKVQFKSFS